MKKKSVAIVVSATVGFVSAVFAGKALANSESFEFTMEEWAVLGKKNDKFHVLEAGELTLSGAIWVVSKKRGTVSAPDRVKIYVKEGTMLPSDVCSESVSPSTTFNEKRKFDKACGHIDSGTYWIYVEKEKQQTDGWDIQGSGTVVTK